jgi:hypothetical protein
LGPTSGYGEIPVIGDGGVWGGVYSQRRALVVRPGDSNPERIIIDDALYSDEPKVTTGDQFSGPIVGVMHYSYGNFKVLNPDPLPGVISAGLTQEFTKPSYNRLTVATFNVENLDPGDSDAKFQGLATIIVSNMRAPDIIGVEEVQDNNGPTDDGTVDASATFQKLIAAIQAAGGPTYDFRQINPLNDEDGGQPGGNIRVGFLFRPDRVTFVDHPGGDGVVRLLVDEDEAARGTVATVAIEVQRGAGLQRDAGDVVEPHLPVLLQLVQCVDVHLVLQLLHQAFHVVGGVAQSVTAAFLQVGL